MKPIRQFIRESSVLFMLHRGVEVARDEVRTRLFGLALSGALGKMGHGARIVPPVTLVRPKGIILGDNSVVAPGCRLTTETDDSLLEIGDRCIIGRDVFLDYSGGLKIGSDTEFSEGVMVYTHDHPHHDFHEREVTPLTVGRHVRFGARVIVLPKVGHIGDGAVLAAGAVVTKAVPSGVLVAGVPAAVVKRISAPFAHEVER